MKEIGATSQEFPRKRVLSHLGDYSLHGHGDKMNPVQRQTYDRGNEISGQIALIAPRNETSPLLVKLFKSTTISQRVSAEAKAIDEG